MDMSNESGEQDLFVTDDAEIGGNLTVNGTITSSGGISTNLTPGSVVFAGSGGQLSEDNTNLFWDDTNDRLGIGTNAPNHTLDVNGTANVTGNVTVGGDLAVNGNTTLGNDGADTVTVNASTMSVPNGLNIDGNTFYIESASDRIGIGTDNPTETVTVKAKVFDSVQYYDSATTTYINDTDEAGKVGGTPYTVLSNSSDLFFVGISGRKFDTIYFDLAQAGSGLILSAEYYNGTGWSPLTITDGTNNLTQDGAITFTPPSDWAETDVNGVTAYWVRLSTGAVTTAPTAYLTVPSSADRLAVYAQSNDDNPALKVDKLGNVIVSGEGTFELQGNARHVKVVRLSPEYANVVFYADGTNNLGTLTSGVDTQNNHYYTYYQWSTSQTTLQDYDVYVRWPVPMEFDGFPVGTDDALVVDIATATTSSTDNAVDVTLYKDGTAGSSSIIDKVSTTAGVWMTDQEGTAVIKFDDSDAVLSSLSAGDVLVIRITLKANDTNSGWAKVGSIRIKYLSKW